MAERVGRFSFGLLTRIECLLILFSVMRSGTFRIFKVCLGWDWLNSQHRAHRLCINAHAYAPFWCAANGLTRGCMAGTRLNCCCATTVPKTLQAECALVHNVSY